MKSPVFHVLLTIKWLDRTAPARELENEQLWAGIQLLAQQVKGIYGYRRMTLTINRYRELANQPLINEKRIYRLGIRIITTGDSSKTKRLLQNKGQPCRRK